MKTPADMLRELCELIAPLQRVVVAYSGGVDSTVVAAAAVRACGAGHVRVCLADSPSLPSREFEAALSTAQEACFDVHVVHTQEIEDPRYAANPENRCFFCKSELYDALLTIMREKSFHAVLDGFNASDAAGHRPSRPAAQARGIRSPLWEAGLAKKDVRSVAHELGLAVAEKPATACLASRIPTGIPVTRQLLAQIERAEDILARAGLRQFRVRHHDDVARIEVAPEELAAVLAHRAEILAGVQAAGYRFVTLDLAGYINTEARVPVTVAGMPFSLRTTLCSTEIQ